MGALVVGVGGPTPATGAPSPASLVVDYKGMGALFVGVGGPTPATGAPFNRS